MEEANRLLGHPHCLVDTVHYGFQLGGKLPGLCGGKCYTGNAMPEIDDG